ncbi:MAG: DUF3634 family protein [Myxococcales bacterium]|jgi:hypothetical protein
MGAYSVLSVVAVIALYALLAIRANEVFCLSVRNGRALIVRGRVPRALLSELSEVVRRARVQRATIRVVRQNAAARMIVHGAGPDVAQRLRNVFGTRSYRDLKLAPPPRERRNLGQRLGWAWLAWRLHGRR